MAQTLPGAMTSVGNMVQGRNTFEFNPFFNATMMLTKKTDKFLNSGLMTFSPELSAKMSGGGMVVEVPYWKDLAANDSLTENVSTDDETTGTTNAIEMIEMQAPFLRRNFGIASADLTAIVNGDDPMGRMISRVEPTWARRRQETLKSVFLGIMDKQVGGKNMYFDGKAAALTADGVLEAEAILGEYSTEATTMIVHPKQFLKMKKDKLVTFEGGTGGSNAGPDTMDSRIAYYDNKRLIVSNDVPTYNNVLADETHGADGTTTYMALIFREGAIAYGETQAKTPIETQRVADGGNGEGLEKMWFRRHFVMHPMGFSYIPSGAQDTLNAAGIKARGLKRSLLSPDNANLANPDNWYSVAYEREQVPFVGLLTL